ncbi:MAG: hypothetical protein J7J96_06345, partial [Sulfurimonas sp.]|nr:hypothetical protein [Sulfurimonas sp.]
SFCDHSFTDSKSNSFCSATHTACIKDRLAAYYHWDDEQCLQQAVWVAEQNEFDLESVKEWSQKEKSLEKFQIFNDKLNID